MALLFLRLLLICVCDVKLLAEDLDSQVNGRITYSILRGDQGNQFWIDPVTGLLKVNKALDREKVRFLNNLHDSHKKINHQGLAFGVFSLQIE